MEKILKRILLSIPILLISFSLTPVKAESIDLYVRTNNARFGLSTSNPIFTTELPSSGIIYFNENIGEYYDYNVHLYSTTWNASIGNYITLYNSDDDYYLFFFYETAPDSLINYNTSTSKFQFCSNDTFNDCSDSGTTFGYFYIIYDSSNNLTDIISSITSNSTLTLNESNFTIKNYNEIYFSYLSDSSRNINNLDFSKFHYYDSRNNFYIDKILQNGYSPTPDEPTPETPGQETPVQNNNDLHYFYVPNYNESMCVEVLDKDTIRVFKNENSSDYIDYYINSNYISKTGQVGLDYIKNCSNLKFSSIEYYRNDFPKILFITIVTFGSSVLFLYVLYKRFRKR